MPVVHRPSATSLLSLTNTPTLDFVADQIHAEWVRWCYTSINKYFDDRKESYDLYIEGDRRTLQEETEFAELRIDGPVIHIPQKDCYILEVQINILCATHVDPRQHYRTQEMVGVFARAFRNNIPVYKYGDGPLDDDSLIGCFKMMQGSGESLDINYFGVIASNTKIVQTSIEGHYRLEL